MAVRVDVDDEEESLVPVIKRRTTFERARATLSPFSRKWKETEGIRHFIIYALFILLFSLVVFNSKPGPIQYEIQAVHRQTLGAGMAQLKTVDMIYDWLKYNFSSTFFPYEDSKGSFLTANKRLTISGAGRVVSAARLRVVRAHQVECKIPNFLKEVNGRPVLCSAEYTAGNRIKEGMYATNSTKGIREDIAALNFTLP